MKKISLLFLVFLFTSLAVQSAVTTSLCPQPPYDVSNKFSQVMSQISGANFTVTKAAELSAQSQIKKQFGANRPNVEVIPYSVGDLSKGKFKSIVITIPSAAKDNIAFTNFKAQTLCDYNHVIVNKKDVKFAQNFLMSFSSDFTNSDLQKITSSQTYLDKLKNVELKIGNFSLLHVIAPKVELKDNKLRMAFGIETPLLFVNNIDNIVITSQLKARDGKIQLANMTVNNTKYDAGILLPIINLLNPLSFSSQFANNMGIAQIKNIDIIDDKISINGLVYIPKNYVIKK